MTTECEYKSTCPIYREENKDACDVLRHMCLRRKKLMLDEEIDMQLTPAPIKPEIKPADKLFHFHDYEPDSRFGDWGGTDGNASRGL